MNECDFMKSQIQIYKKLAEDLLNDEMQIKRQREDFFHLRGNPNSIEAKKMNFARAEAEVKMIIEKEDRLKAAHALRLALQAQEQLKQMEAERHKRKEEEYYYYEQYIKQKPVEARENLVDKIKQLMEFFNKLLGQLNNLIKQLSAQIEHLRGLKKFIIDNQMVPIVNRIRDDLIKQIPYSVNGATVDLTDPLTKLFNTFIKELHKGTLSLHNWKEKWLGGPYVDGEIMSCLKDTSLNESDKRILKEEIWSSLQKHPFFDVLCKPMQLVDTIENAIVKKAEPLMHALKETVTDIEECEKNLSNIARAGAQSVADHMDINGLIKETAEIEKQMKAFMEKSQGKINYITKVIQGEEEKISQVQSFTRKDDEEPQHTLRR